MVNHIQRWAMLKFLKKCLAAIRGYFRRESLTEEMDRLIGPAPTTPTETQVKLELEIPKDRLIRVLHPDHNNI